MSKVLSLVNYEFRMSIQRKSLWAAFGMLAILYAVLTYDPALIIQSDWTLAGRVWQSAGEIMYLLNMFVPVAAGVLSADRARRDFQCGVRELQTSAPLRRSTYVLGKYLGVLASMVLPSFGLATLTGAIVVLRAQAPAALLGAMVVTFVVMALPALAFVVTFSLICPLVMPLRIYQILFVGYWFWANALNPQAFPTLNGTFLTPIGLHALHGFFHATGRFSADGMTVYSSTEAVLNLAVLAGSIVLVLSALGWYLRSREQAS